MIHAIYQRSRPKNKWHLVSLAMSAEAANMEVATFKKQAADEGNDLTEVAMRIFESSFWIPEYVDDIKDQKPMFN